MSTKALSVPSAQNDFFAPVEVPDGFKKAVGVVQVAMGKLGFLHRKIYNVMLANAAKGLEQGETQFQVSAGVVARMAGFDSKNYQAIYDHCRELMTVEVLTVDFDAKSTARKRKVNRRGGTTLVSEFDVVDGKITYGFSPKMAKILHDPDQYIWMTLSAQSNFSSKYELNLYENAIRYLRVGSTGHKSVEEWRSLLGAEEETYDEFKHLNTKVIKKAAKGVSEKSPIIVEPEYEREKRKVARIKFSVRENPQASLLNYKEHDRMRATNAYAGATKLGLKEIEVFYWIETKGEIYLEEAVAYVLKQKKVANAAGYLVKALQEGFGEKTPAERNAEAKAAQAVADRKAAKVAEEHVEAEAKALQAEFNDYVREQGRAIIETLTPVQRAELKTKAREKLAINPMIRKRFDDVEGDFDKLKNTPPDKLVKSYIARAAITYWGEPDILAIEAYAAERSISPAVVKKIKI